MGNFPHRTAQAYNTLSVEGSPELKDGMLGLVLECPRSSRLHRNQTVLITIEPHMIRFDPPGSTRADRAVRTPLFATSHLQLKGWSSDQVNSTWTFSTGSGSRYTMQVHDPSRIANQVAAQAAINKDQLDLDGSTPSLSLHNASPVLSAAQRIRSSTIDRSSPQSSPQLSAPVLDWCSNMDQNDEIRIPESPASLIKSHQRTQRLSLRSTNSLQTMIQELQELGFHTESVPTSLSEVMASIQVLCRELVELQRQILLHRNFENGVQKERKKERKKSTLQQAEVIDQMSRESKLQFEQMLLKAKKMDNLIEYLMDMSHKLKAQQRYEEEEPPSLDLNI